MSRFTQSLTMHLNGGKKFSELHYEILVDGKKLGITRHTRTNGSPNYTVTADELHCGDETFDLLATKGAGAFNWLDKQADAMLKARGES